MIKIKQLPNILTGARIVLSISLLFIVPKSITFFVIYFLTGLTDVLDGFFARKFNCASAFGASFDSVSDVVFTAVLIFNLVFRFGIAWQRWMVITVISVAMVKIIAVVSGSVKFHTILFLHTYLNKLTGLLMFLFPLAIIRLSVPLAFIIVSAAALVAGVEEFLINVLSHEAERDAKSLCSIKGKLRT